MQNQHYFFRNEGNLQQIQLHDVVLLRAEGNYTRFFEKKESYLVRATLDTVLKKVPSHVFIRTHRSYAVALSYIHQLGREELSFNFTCEEAIPVSKQFYAQALKQIVIFEDASSKRRNRKKPGDDRVLAEPA